MSNAEHPVGQFMDWVASGGRPSEDDYAKLIARCVDGQTADIDGPTLRRELASAARDIRAAHLIGNSGQARSIARETTAVLSTALGELPGVDKGAGVPIRTIIENIPR